MYSPVAKSVGTLNEYVPSALSVSSQNAGAFWKPGFGNFVISSSGTWNPNGEIPRFTTSFCLNSPNVGSLSPG